MGILIQRSDDSQLYKDAYEEAQRIIRISEEVRISMERVSSDPATAQVAAETGEDSDAAGGKLPSGKLAQKLGMKTAELLSRAAEQGYLVLNGDKHVLTPKGEQAGIEFVAKGRFGPYFLWPQDFHPI
jgi:hypothetical protein